MSYEAIDQVQDEMSLLDATLVVCMLGDLCLPEIKDDTLGQELATVVGDPFLFKWTRAYARVRNGHTSDLFSLDITPGAPEDELVELKDVFARRLCNDTGWQEKLQKILDTTKSSGINALAIACLPE